MHGKLRALKLIKGTQLCGDITKMGGGEEAEKILIATTAKNRQQHYLMMQIFYYIYIWFLSSVHQLFVPHSILPHPFPLLSSQK